MFTPEETAFLMQLFQQLQISPLNPQAATTLALVQSIAAKLQTPEPPEAPHD